MQLVILHGGGGAIGYRKPEELEWDETLAKGAIIRAYELQMIGGHSRPYDLLLDDIYLYDVITYIGQRNYSVEASHNHWSDGHKASMLYPGSFYGGVGIYETGDACYMTYAAGRQESTVQYNLDSKWDGKFDANGDPTILNDIEGRFIVY